MKTEQDFELLTPELYMEISNDKSSLIANLKNEKLLILKRIKGELEDLKKLQDSKKELNRQIKQYKRIIRSERNEKFKLTRELGKQKRLSNNLNKIFTEEEPYIWLDDFYPEKKSTKKR